MSGRKFTKSHRSRGSPADLRSRISSARKVAADRGEPKPNGIAVTRGCADVTFVANHRTTLAGRNFCRNASQGRSPSPVTRTIFFLVKRRRSKSFKTSSILQKRISAGWKFASPQGPSLHQKARSHQSRQESQVKIFTKLICFVFLFVYTRTYENHHARRGGLCPSQSLEA